MLNPSPWILCIWFFAATKKPQHIWAWQLREGQKATIACKSRRPNRLKVLQTACIASKWPNGKAEFTHFQNSSFLWLLFLNPYFLFWLFYSSVFFIFQLRALFKLGSQTAGRSLYVCFQNPPFPTKAPVLLALSCSPAQQWSRAADTWGTFGQPSLTHSCSAWGITAPGTLWKAAQQGHGVLKTLLESKAQDLPLFLPCTLFLSRPRISWQSSQYTNYRLLSWIKT